MDGGFSHRILLLVIGDGLYGRREGRPFGNSVREGHVQAFPPNAVGRFGFQRMWSCILTTGLGMHSVRRYVQEHLTPIPEHT